MSVKHTSDQFMGAGERLHLQSWLPAGADPEQLRGRPPRSPWSTGTATTAAASILGRGGYGRSRLRGVRLRLARPRPVAGTRGQIKRFADYLDDTAVFLDEVRRRQPGKPIVLLGHSLGGLDLCALRGGAPLRRAGAHSLPRSSRCTVQPEPTKVRRRQAAVGRLAGRDIGNTVRAAISQHDRTVVDAYVTDPLVHHVATARWAAETLAAQDAAMAAAPSVTLPLLLLYGKDDQVADPAFMEVFFATVGSTAKKLIHYEHFYHELFNELDRDQVFADVAAWLAERVHAGAGGLPEPPAGTVEPPGPLAGGRRPRLTGPEIQRSATGGWVERVSPGRPAVLM